MSILRTRTPELFGDPVAVDGGYAWVTDDNGNLVQTGNYALLPGQAWEYDNNENLKPNGATITDDPFWKYDGNGDLVPI